MGEWDMADCLLADVTMLGNIPDISEIAEVRLVDYLPEDLTYPDIQPHLFARVKLS